MLRDAVAKVEKTGERSVRYTFTDNGSRELPLLVGLLVVLPKHAIDPRDLRQDYAHARRSAPALTRSPR